ncbi:hypothetical protein ES332_A06G108300v1 [Gossypium tomentosum]|uniref:Uncharacterized protein n=1 Tax=Gossypium tomentosum TaxID=34277 RepID=A0A5D2Q222_GOSTO|nr:hypothetical protein ES332_A06G108300v1 [Gossypium tomentosum]
MQNFIMSINRISAHKLVPVCRSEKTHRDRHQRIIQRKHIILAIFVPRKSHRRVLVGVKTTYFHHFCFSVIPFMIRNLMACLRLPLFGRTIALIVSLSIRFAARDRLQFPGAADFFRPTSWSPWSISIWACSKPNPEIS